MQILFIVPYVPTQIRVRPYNLLKTLVEQNHQVTLATLWGSEAERAHLKTLEEIGLNVLASPLSRLQSLRNCLGKLPTTTPLQAVYCWQPKLLYAIKALLATETFDAIHVEHLRGAHYGLALKNEGVPIVWDSVDCISYLFEQAVDHSRSLFGKWITRLELGRTRQYEAWLVDQFDTTLVTSEIDKQALIRLTNSQQPAAATDRILDTTYESQSQIQNRIKVLRNGVDQAYFKPNGRQHDPETLVLSGKMSYHANITMALHLVQDIMPYIWAERPTTKVTIVGQNPPPAVQKLGIDPRVTVTGFVPDIRPYLQQATAAVVPSAYGAGIQNKVLEAMACGTPVVAMERATTALDLKPEQDLLVANESRTFAQQALRLLDDSALRRTVGLTGLKYVQREHTWSTIGVKLEEIYRCLAEQGL